MLCSPMLWVGIEGFHFVEITISNSISMFFNDNSDGDAQPYSRWVRFQGLLEEDLALTGEIVLKKGESVKFLIVSPWSPRQHNWIRPVDGPIYLYEVNLIAVPNPSAACGELSIKGVLDKYSFFSQWNNHLDRRGGLPKKFKSYFPLIQNSIFKVSFGYTLKGW